MTLSKTVEQRNDSFVFSFYFLSANCRLITANNLINASEIH